MALLFAVAYALSAFALVWVVNGAVIRYATHTASLTLLEESAALRQDDRQRGRAALIREIGARPSPVRAHPFLYLVLGPGGRRLAGDLAIPATKLGWGQTTIVEPAEADDPGQETSPAETYGVTLPDGAILIVARETFDVQELSQWLAKVTLWSGLGVAILAVLGSFGVAALFLRRLERVNDTVQRIAEGGHHERLPPIGLGAEFDRLSANVNVMLDRITALMASMRQVSSNVAHDLRTPLTRLRNRLEAARESSSVLEYEASVEDALIQVDDILAIFRALLRIGMIEGGAGRSRFIAVDLSTILERVRLAYQPAAEDAGKVLNVEIAPGLEVLGDAELLTQAFANLVENALTHTPIGTVIHLALERRAAGVVASVADDGPGVPEAARDKVLDRFYTLDPSRTRGGSGLGLALVAAIANLHGARLTLCDNDPGLRVEVGFPVEASSVRA